MKFSNEWPKKTCINFSTNCSRYSERDAQRKYPEYHTLKKTSHGFKKAKGSPKTKKFSKIFATKFLKVFPKKYKEMPKFKMEFLNKLSKESPMKFPKKPLK